MTTCLPSISAALPLRQPDRLIRQEDPRGDAPEQTPGRADRGSCRPSDGYQNAAYADRYREIVAKVRAAEQGIGSG
jgi:indolepyruvate ferredoxin oxidoreductase